MSGLIKSSSKILAIAALAISFSAISSAQDAGTSIIGAMKNQSAVENTAPSANKGGSTGGSGHSSGGSTSGHSSGGSSGGHSNGGGHGGPPPECVPEPVSMLALGIGAGIVALKKRAKKA